MNISKLIVAIAFVLTASSALAQAEHKYSKSYDNPCTSYNRINVEYTWTKMWSGDDNSLFIKECGNHINLHGAAIEYIHGFNLSQRIPLFIETGAKINGGFGHQTIKTVTTSTRDVKLQMKNFYLAVPVNLAYRIKAGNNILITPYIGINLKLNFALRSRRIFVPDVIVGPDGIPTLKENIDTGWKSLYTDDSSSAFGEKYHYQVGWHAGIGMECKFLYWGINYGTDFTKPLNGIQSSNLAASVGFLF